MTKTKEPIGTVQEQNPEAHTYTAQQADSPPVAPKPIKPATEKQHAEMVQHLCTQWLDGWGRTLKERALTNDPSCVPRDSWQVNGGGRGKPAGVPGILDVFLDVESVLHELESQRPPALAVRAIAAFIHRDCVSHETTSVAVQFEDGTTKHFTNLKEFREAPPKNVAEVVPIIRRTERVDWKRFHPPAPIGSDAAIFGMSPEQFCRASYLALRERLIISRGLSTLAADYLQRGIRIHVK